MAAFFGMFISIFAFSAGMVERVFAETNSDAALAGYSPTSALRFGEAVLTERDGLFIVDYQNIKLPKNAEIDFIGYHILSPITDWLYFGFGGYAPFLKGEYGGFMAFGGLLHAKVNITDTLFATAGLSFGGGGGGKSVAHSIELSGTGGYMRGYVGFGYQFENFAVGANISRMTFLNSAINNTQINFFIEKPFTYSIGTYGNAGSPFSSVPQSSRNSFGSMVSFSLDNYVQINPVGSYKGVINAADIQFSNFMSENTYWYYAVAVGYKGLPIYNQVIAGVGARAALSERFRLYGQVGLGSGGYAPSLIDTGSGLLLYPKLSAEYRISDNLGLALTAGYLLALDGTSKNYTFGVALNRTFGAASRQGTTQGQYDGYRFSLSHETLSGLRFNGLSLANLNMLTVQVDKLVSGTFYIPVRVAISYQSYLGFPGYGEVSTGIGIQNSYTAGDRFQFFGEVQIGANVQGIIVRPSIGLDYGLREGLALRASIGQTFGKKGFRSTNIVLGLTSRFSLLNL